MPESRLGKQQHSDQIQARATFALSVVILDQLLLLLSFGGRSSSLVAVLSDVLVATSERASLPNGRRSATWRASFRSGSGARMRRVATPNGPTQLGQQTALSSAQRLSISYSNGVFVPKHYSFSSFSFARLSATNWAQINSSHSPLPAAWRPPFGWPLSLWLGGINGLNTRHQWCLVFSACCSALSVWRRRAGGP